MLFNSLWNTYYCSFFIVFSLDDSEVLKSVVHAYVKKEIDAEFVASTRGWSTHRMADFGKQTRKIRAAKEKDEEFEHGNLKKTRKPNYQQTRQELLRDVMEKHKSNKQTPSSQQVF